MPPPDTFCSQDSSRSFLDALSNICVLKGIDPYDPAAVTDGTMPIERLSLLVHEYTHHWSMFSPLGTALSITKIDALRAWLGAGSDPNRDLAAIERWQAVATLARVWTEGLAQYAEFDATPGEAKSVTSVAQVVMELFCRKDLSAEQGSAAWALAVDRLEQSRALYSTVVRKATTFRSSFSTHNGGYLSGYLQIKILANRLALAGGPFTDSDFVMCYLKEYVFNDAWLALAALGRRGKDNLLESVLAHFSERIAALMLASNDQLRKAGEEFDEAAARQKMTDTGLPMPGLGIDPKDVIECYEILIKRLSDPLQQEPASDGQPGQLDKDRELQRRVGEWLGNIADAIYRQRRYLCLGATEVKNPRFALLRSGHPVVLYSLPSAMKEDTGALMAVYDREYYVDWDTLHDFQADPAHVGRVEGYPEEGATLELWCEPRWGNVYQVLFVGNRRVGIMVLRGSTKMDDVPFDLLPRDDTLNGLSRINAQLLDKKLRTSDGPPQPRRLEEELEASRRYVCSRLDETLADLLLGPEGDHGRRAIEQLADRGIGGLPGSSTSSLLDLARLTLSPDSTDYPESVRVLLNELQSLGLEGRVGERWLI